MVDAGKFIPFLALALLLAVLPLRAQEENEAQAASPEASAEEPADDSPPPESDDSPFDYESSEQISEDLSVSFPVDI